MKNLLITILILSPYFVVARDTSFGDVLVETNSIQQTFDIEKSTNQFLNTLTDEQKEKSDDYFEGGYWVLLWALIFDIIVAWLFLARGLSAKVKNIGSRLTGNVNLQNFIYVVLYTLITYILLYPWILYKDFFREHNYELSNQSWGEWMGDEIISLLLFALFSGGLFVCLYIAIRKVEKTWWMWGSAITLVFLVIILFVAPVFISPLFNEYKPLEEGPFKESILSMARANGVPVDNVYMFDASKQSDRISANVSGIGGTIRISLNDNLLNQCSEGEVKAVMGHELGHYVLNHSYESLVMFGLVFLIGFAFINSVYSMVLNMWGSNWGINGLSDIQGFPLIMVLLSVYFFFASPVTNSIIRTNEEEADVYGLNAAREPDGFAGVSMKLSTYRKINPGYWERMIFFDHPVAMIVF